MRHVCTHNFVSVGAHIISRVNTGTDPIISILIFTKGIPRGIQTYFHFYSVHYTISNFHKFIKTTRAKNTNKF